MSSEYNFTKEELNLYLKELGKEYRKRSKEPVEIILVGGASVLINYNFRNSTNDADAYISNNKVIKEAMKAVAEKHKLSKKWLNDDFKKTDSFTPMIRNFSKKYKQYSNLLDIYTIDAEHLIAMKLVAGRDYKYDLSDIVGVLLEHEKAEKPITKELIIKAFIDLYGNNMTKEQEVLLDTIYGQDYEELYENIRSIEMKNREIKIESINKAMT